MAATESKPSDNPSSATNGEKKPSDASLKTEGTTNAEPGQPLAPPPKPNENGGDYFSSNLSLEPNPFEQSFSNGGTVETPGGTKLPSVAALTSPSSLLPGNGNTPFNWGGGSLRTGPLSPAMLSGPTNDYFGDTSHTLRGGFTPNESSLRTGLTPGGSGSMFPAPSPNSQALFNQLASGGATPSTLDFHRTAMSAAAAKANRDQNQSATSAPQDMANGAVKAENKPTSGQFDPHDNDAANGLFMLAQGAQQRNGGQTTNQQFPVGGNQPGHAHPAPATQNNTSPHVNSKGNGSSIDASSVRGVSEAASGASDEMEHSRPTTRGKGKRGSGASNAIPNGRRKAEEPPAKQPASKKMKTAPSSNDDEDHSSDEDEDGHMGKDENGQPKSKMTDEEKRKNFLERNRVAALKCRQRKKQWLANLQNKVEMFSSENDALTAQISQLREEVVNLKTLLLAHKDCPVTQQQGLHGAFMQQAMESYNPQMNPYGMGAPIQNQQSVMAGQSVQRRFS
ncbi:Aft1 HRA domain-containing protein [Pseudomassariella vexata]|uniref:Aft1 HRA domain-domain-containing protein n=1 Tax=Pseudomassariella vexata TaxID=1141098 RepID=A0A1Y2E277_9PEZI|nr:Aft1 HRA domain-containing protein [Pseudomassariella vexata]ORY65426.1 Aft1 HRA domain-domain-containing protein [Pseudomassariella vexata]